MFGHQIKFITEVIRAKFNPLDAGSSSRSLDAKLALTNKFAQMIMQIIVSLVLLVIGILLLFKKDTPELQKYGYGLIGIVVGYWLR